MSDHDRLLRSLARLARDWLRGELRRAKRRRSSVGTVALVVALTIAVFALERYLQEPDLPVPKPGSDLVCALRDVADGDTVTVGCEQGQLKVRVWGIDAPETGQKPWGQESKEFLETLLKGAGDLTVQVVDKDRYGRAVARLYIGREDVGLNMVREGKAVVYAQYNDSDEYRAAERTARAGELGVWSEPGAQQDPAAWRRVNAAGRGR